MRVGLHEGAIEIRDGKARLVAETYCDGLGACLGECPQDAINIIEREADAFSEELVRQRVALLGILAPIRLVPAYKPDYFSGPKWSRTRSARIL